MITKVAAICYKTAQTFMNVVIWRKKCLTYLLITMHLKTIKTKCILLLVRKKYSDTTKFETCYPKNFPNCHHGHIWKCPQVYVISCELCSLTLQYSRLNMTIKKNLILKPHKRLDLLSLRWNLGWVLPEKITYIFIDAAQ